MDRDLPVREWWTDYKIDVDHGGVWRIGPCHVCIARTRLEWRITYWYERDPMDPAVDVTLNQTESAFPLPDSDTGIEADADRFGFERTDAQLTLRPALADRPIVIRPESDLFIPSEEHVTIYVSTPLWIEIRVGVPPRKLTEIPTFRPSDSWFGPNTREGELCYASYTHGRLSLESVPRRLHRAITPVRISNRSATPLQLQRFRLPVAYLSLYQDDDGFLWTDTVLLDRSEKSDHAVLNLSAGAPEEAGSAPLVSTPREEAGRNVLVRTFSSILSRITEE